MTDITHGIIAAPPGRRQAARLARCAAGVLLAGLVAGCARHEAPPAVPPAARRVAVPVRASDTAPAPAVTPSPTPTPAASATAPEPTATARPDDGVSAAPRAEAPVGAREPLLTGVPGDRLQLSGVRHVWQKWNNCGPSSLLMALSAFGVELDQLAVAAALKPDREDTNVTPAEMADHARDLGLAARVGFGGNAELAKALVRAGVPVLAEQWIDVEGRGEMGHYRVIIGYDDATGEAIVHDSYYGASRRYAYADLERMWRPFLGAYVVAYLPGQAEAVRDALGSDWDEATMSARTLGEAEQRALASPDEAWAQFALGEARAHTGDFAGSVAAFDRAVGIGLPFRAFWYQFGYHRALYETGADDRLIALADATLESMHGENLEESRYWRGMALRRLGREAEAVAEFERALSFNPYYAPAEDALTVRPIAAPAP